MYITNIKKYVSYMYDNTFVRFIYIYKYHHFHVFVQLELAWRKKKDATNRYSN